MSILDKYPAPWREAWYGEEWETTPNGETRRIREFGESGDLALHDIVDANGTPVLQWTGYEDVDYSDEGVKRIVMKAPELLAALMKVCSPGLNLEELEQAINRARTLIARIEKGE